MALHPSQEARALYTNLTQLVGDQILTERDVFRLPAVNPRDGEVSLDALPPGIQTSVPLENIRFEGGYRFIAADLAASIREALNNGGYLNVAETRLAQAAPVIRTLVKQEAVREHEGMYAEQQAEVVNQHTQRWAAGQAERTRQHDEAVAQARTAHADAMRAFEAVRLHSPEGRRRLQAEATYRRQVEAARAAGVAPPAEPNFGPPLPAVPILILPDEQRMPVVPRIAPDLTLNVALPTNGGVGDCILCLETRSVFRLHPEDPEHREMVYCKGCILNTLRDFVLNTSGRIQNTYEARAGARLGCIAGDEAHPCPFKVPWYRLLQILCNNPLERTSPEAVGSVESWHAQSQNSCQEFIRLYQTHYRSIEEARTRPLREGREAFETNKPMRLRALTDQIPPTIEQLRLVLQRIRGQQQQRGSYEDALEIYRRQLADWQQRQTVQTALREAFTTMNTQANPFLTVAEVNNPTWLAPGTWSMCPFCMVMVQKESACDHVTNHTHCNRDAYIASLYGIRGGPSGSELTEFCYKCGGYYRGPEHDMCPGRRVYIGRLLALRRELMIMLGQGERYTASPEQRARLLRAMHEAAAAYRMGDRAEVEALIAQARGRGGGNLGFRILANLPPVEERPREPARPSGVVVVELPLPSASNVAESEMELAQADSIVSAQPAGVELEPAQLNALVRARVNHLLITIGRLDQRTIDTIRPRVLGAANRAAAEAAVTVARAEADRLNGEVARLVANGRNLNAQRAAEAAAAVAYTTLRQAQAALEGREVAPRVNRSAEEAAVRAAQANVDRLNGEVARLVGEGLNLNAQRTAEAAAAAAYNVLRQAQAALEGREVAPRVNRSANEAVLRTAQAEAARLNAEFAQAMGAGQAPRAGLEAEIQAAYNAVRRAQIGGTLQEQTANEVQPTLTNIVYYLNNINKLWYHDGANDKNGQCPPESRKTVIGVSNKNNKKTYKNKAHKVNKLKSRKNNRYILKV